MSSSLALFAKATRDSWHGLVGWAAAIAVMTLVYLPLHRSFGDASMAQVMESMPQALVKAMNYDLIASGPGYVQATIYGLLGFAFLTIAAVGWGGQAVGGDEEAGRLELTLAHAVSRSQVVLERALAMTLKVIILAGVTVALVLALNGPSDLGVDVGNALETSVVFATLALLPGATALCVGAWSGRRVPALVAGTAVAVLGYALNGLGNQGDNLEWMHAISPYYWAYGNQPLVNGVDWVACALLAGLSAALVALAVVGLNRRDVAV